MKITKFLNIDIEPAPPELELEIEMQCREIMKANDIDNVKRYCTHLIRHQMKQDVFLSSVLERVVELETLLARREIIEEKKTIDRIKKFFHIYKYSLEYRNKFLEVLTKTK